MSYTNEELIEHVNAHIRRDEELHRQTLECIEIKKGLWVRQELRRIIAEQGADITDDEFQQIVEESLRFMDEQQGQRTIIINEIQLGRAIVNNDKTMSPIDDDKVLNADDAMTLILNAVESGDEDAKIRQLVKRIDEQTGYSNGVMRPC